MTQTSAPPTRSAPSEPPFTLLFADLDGELKTTRRILMLTRDEYDGTAGMPRANPADNAKRLKMFDEVSGELRR